MNVFLSFSYRLPVFVLNNVTFAELKAHQMKQLYIYIIIAISVFFCRETAFAAEEMNSKELRNLADEKYYSEQFPEALEYSIKAMEQAEREGDKENYIVCTGYVGNIYDTFGDNRACLYYYTKGYNAARQLGNKKLQTRLLSNIVICCARMGNAQQAREYLSRFERLRGSCDETWYNYYLYYCRALVLSAEHHYTEAVREHRIAKDYALANRMKPLYVLFQMSEIGNAYVRSGNYRQAISMGDSCIAMAQKINSGELLVNAYKMLADAYTQADKYDSAQHYRNLYYDLNDSVYNIKKFYKARYTLSEYENKEHTKQVAVLNERITWQIYVIVVVVVFLVLVSILTFIIIRKNRRLVTAQRLLIEKSKDVEQRDKQNSQLLVESLKPAAPLNDDNERKLLGRINEAMDDTAVISNPDMSLQMLAEIVGSNTNYVSHIINAHYQKNFKTLLNERRIREACHKLADRDQYGNYTMQAIYQEVGYRNAVSFIRAFKKIYGMTPSEYQRIALADGSTAEGQEE